MYIWVVWVKSRYSSINMCTIRSTRSVLWAVYYLGPELQNLPHRLHGVCKEHWAKNSMRLLHTMGVWHRRSIWLSLHGDRGHVVTECDHISHMWYNLVTQGPTMCYLVSTVPSWYDEVVPRCPLQRRYRKIHARLPGYSAPIVQNSYFWIPHSTASPCQADAMPENY